MNSLILMIEMNANSCGKHQEIERQQNGVFFRQGTRWGCRLERKVWRLLLRETQRQLSAGGILEVVSKG